MTRRKRCKVCRGELPEVAVKHGDPYCSATCAREAYGTQLRTTPSATEATRKSMTEGRR